MFRLFISVVAFLIPVAASSEVLPPAMAEDYDRMVSSGPTLNIGLVRNGNAADNNLGGTSLKDAFFGAEGNDLLVGYDSVDTYTFEAGHGADTVVDHSAEGNRIKFLDVPEGSVKRSDVPGFDGETDLLLTYGESDAIRIVGWSELSDETKSAWKFDHVFRPKQEPIAERPSSIMLILTDSKSAFMLLLLIFLGFFPMVRLLWVRWRK